MYKETRIGPIPLDAYVDAVVTTWAREDEKMQARICGLDESKAMRDLDAQLAAGLIHRGIRREDINSVAWQAFCHVNFIKGEFAYYDR